eukprot:TRINITY_DN27365_c0_g1_i1.p1 TRINITY_DN27365_c0_g1~~TRINITY_DN27365_c0_g1_i1.p1  ORF type:complete len:183 (-),score=26.56 TRINITY_DN27365_c0_g1_i1:37-585(-)
MKVGTTIVFLFALIAVCVGWRNISHPILTWEANMQVTSYGFNDNSPPSAQIAYPRNAGYPTLHNQATETSGTYNDPITFATSKAEIPIGTKIYIPFLSKYFIMEDDCTQCDSDWKSGRRHVDLWMGPQYSSNTNSLDNCEGYISKSSANVIVNPPSNLGVCQTKMFQNNQCTANQCCKGCGQ